MGHTPTLIESLRDNGGKRSITRATLPAGAKALRHYHNEYNETFLIHAGQLTIFHNGKDHLITASSTSKDDKAKSYTVPIGETHAFYNKSKEDVVVDFILEPGHAGCEMTNDIVTGLERDSRIAELTAFGGYNLLWTVIYDLTNTIPIGLPGTVYGFLRSMYGKKKIEIVKRELVIKYCKHYYL